MDNKIITCLKIVQEGRDRHGSIPYTYPDELPKGYNKSNIDYYRDMGVLGKDGNVLHLTPLGYQTLQTHYSLELNKKMLAHTKTMKYLTMALLVLTIVNLILTGVQIFAIK